METTIFIGSIEMIRWMHNGLEFTAPKKGVEIYGKGYFEQMFEYTDLNELPDPANVLEDGWEVWEPEGYKNENYMPEWIW